MLTKITCALRRDQRSAGTALLPFSAFTFIELLVVIALLAVFATLLVPASAHIRPNSQAIQCLNNLRQMASAWKMYADDNGSKIVSAYPDYGGFTATWCAGNATTGGLPGSYVYGGADPTGIQKGLLWPYTKTLGLYHCPTDHRVAAAGAPFAGQPILRSISMNAFMDGTSFGTKADWVVTSPNNAMDPNLPVYQKESQIRFPVTTFLVVDEDQESINDGMLFVSVGVGEPQKFYDLPSRAHGMAYGINFCDGHAEIDRFLDPTIASWTVLNDTVGYSDWVRFTNFVTHPL